MKNYKLYSLRLAKTGVVFGINKFNQKWIEFWFKGKFHVIQLKKPVIQVPNVTREINCVFPINNYDNLDYSKGIQNL